MVEKFPCLICEEGDPYSNMVCENCEEDIERLREKTNPNSLKCMLFMGDQFYPNGGWFDYVGLFEDRESAKNWIKDNDPESLYRWAHIVENGKVVLKGESDNEIPSGWLWDEKEE